MRTEISCMRIAAAFAVVLIHVSAGVVNQADSGTWFAGQVFGCLGRWAVPVFVMISGALLLDNPRHEPILHFYSKRALKLLPPLILWNAIYFRFMYWGADLSVAQAVDIAVYKGGFYWHLWYLPMALGLCLTTPFLRFCIARAPRRVLLGLLVLFLVSVFGYFQIARNPFGHWPMIAQAIPFLGYFVLGYFVLGHCLNSAPVGKRASWLCVGCFTAAYACTVGANCLWGAGSRFEHPLSPTVLVMGVSLFLLFRNWFDGRDFGHDRWMHSVAGATMGIYLVHPLVIHTFHRFSISETRWPWLSIPLLTVTVFLISLALCLTWARTRLLAQQRWIAPRREKIAPVVNYDVGT